MRNVRGFDAIALAEEYRISLYDLYLKNELSVHEAKQFVESQRDPQSFVILNWPDTDEEAEQVVLTAYEQLLRKDRLAAAHLDEVLDRIGQVQLNLYAAELAAERLVERGLLEADRTTVDGTAYCLPRVYYFNQSFLQSFSQGMCEACASTGMEGPFHKICLEHLLTDLLDAPPSVDSVATVEARPLSTLRYDSLAERLRPSIDLLSKKVSGTKDRWKSVLKPILARGVPEMSASDEQREIQSGEDSLPNRRRMTKSDLIAYLQSIEILDDSGEVAQLQAERSDLFRKLESREHRIVELEQERAYWEGQFAELSRDMRTMIDAMEIAKRRGASDAVTQNLGSNGHRDSNALTD